MPRESLRMKREVSTSTIGHEERKPQMEAYMFERRMLFACSVLYGISLIGWIVAISTDHWIIISGVGGIFIPETRRFFMSSHSGLWRHCRYTTIPYALPDARVGRNFTSIAFQTPSNIIDAKLNISKEPYINDFLDVNASFPINDFNDNIKRRMFAHWVRNDEMFIDFKKEFLGFISTLPKFNIPLKDEPPILLRPDDINTKTKFGDSLMEVKINNTDYFIIAPSAARIAIFDGWNGHLYVPKLFWPYARDLNIPAYVTNNEGYILQLVPPKPPKNTKNANGYEYTPNRKCKYIKMFSEEAEKDPGFDEELLDYIRTQASFACINVFVMALGLVFAFYTFLNPRYMFKRLAGGVLLVSAFTTLVVIQVLLASVDYTREHLIFAYPEGAEFSCYMELQDNHKFKDNSTVKLRSS
ncbi:hypothetical protein ACFFRR_001152 [Megaselia abdita]